MFCHSARLNSLPIPNVLCWSCPNWIIRSSSLPSSTSTTYTIPNLWPVRYTADNAIWAGVVPSKVWGLVSQVSQFPQGSPVSSKYSSNTCLRQIAASHRPSKALSFWFSIRFCSSGASEFSIQFLCITASSIP